MELTELNIVDFHNNPFIYTGVSIPIETIMCSTIHSVHLPKTWDKIQFIYIMNPNYIVVDYVDPSRNEPYNIRHWKLSQLSSYVQIPPLTHRVADCTLTNEEQLYIVSNKTNKSFVYTGTPRQWSMLTNPSKPSKMWISTHPMNLHIDTNTNCIGLRWPQMVDMWINDPYVELELRLKTDKQNFQSIMDHLHQICSYKGYEDLIDTYTSTICRNRYSMTTEQTDCFQIRRLSSFVVQVPRNTVRFATKREVPVDNTSNSHPVTFKRKKTVHRFDYNHKWLIECSIVVTNELITYEIEIELQRHSELLAMEPFLLLKQCVWKLYMLLLCNHPYFSYISLENFQ